MSTVQKLQKYSVHTLITTALLTLSFALVLLFSGFNGLDLINHGRLSYEVDVEGSEILLESSTSFLGSGISYQDSSGSWSDVQEIKDTLSSKFSDRYMAYVPLKTGSSKVRIYGKDNVDFVVAPSRDNKVLGASISANDVGSDNTYLKALGVETVESTDLPETGELYDVKNILVVRFPFDLNSSDISADRILELCINGSTTCTVDQTVSSTGVNTALMSDGRVLDVGVSGEDSINDSLFVLGVFEDSPVEIEGSNGPLLQKLVSTNLNIHSLSENDISFENADGSRWNWGYTVFRENLARDIEESSDDFIDEADLTVDRVLTVDGKVQVLVINEDGGDDESLLKSAKASKLGALNVQDQDRAVYEVPTELADEVINKMRIENPEATIQPNYIYTLQSWDNSDPDRSIPSDYDVATHWHLEKINAPEAWKDLGGCVSNDSCTGDSSIKIAVIDTGVAFENYDYDAGGSFSDYLFDPLYVQVPATSSANSVYNEGYDREFRLASELNGVTFDTPYDSWQDYACNTLRLSGGDPQPCNYRETARISHPNDMDGHGTFVTSIIASNISDAAPNKVVGIASNTTIIPINVFTPYDVSMCISSSGGIDPTCAAPGTVDYRSVALTTTIVDGIQHSLNNGAKIINMSLGGVGTDPAIDAAITNARNNDVLVVVAAGNYDDDTQYYFPANSPDAFVVGASNTSDGRASYSNYGDEIDVVAPVGDSSPLATGVWYSCSAGGDCSDESDSNLFKTFTSSTSPSGGAGTSFAAPQVAAAAALVWTVNPDWTVVEVENSLRNSAKDLGTAGFDTSFGYGMLDVEGALGGSTAPPSEGGGSGSGGPSGGEDFDDNLYFTWYDASKSSRKAWILVGNPADSGTANVNIKIGTIINENFSIPAGGRVTPKWPGEIGGPVLVSSSDPIYASQRADYEGSFNEYPSILGSKLTDEYNFTWYDASVSNRKAWILVGNPSSTDTANVNIKIGNLVNENFSVPPGGKVTPKWPGLIGGPITVDSDIPVYASQRADYKGSFNEYAGIPADSLGTKYYFTWYDMSKGSRQAWILVGNPSSSQGANVNIKIGNSVNEDFWIAPGDKVTPKWPGVLDGPVTVTSDIPVYTSQRAEYDGSFNEYAGIPATDLGRKYYFTWYDTSKGSRQAWILVGNPSSYQTANIVVKVGSVITENFIIPPGGRVTPKWLGYLDGPVTVTSDIPVYTSQRAEYDGSFNEYAGIRFE